MRIARLRFHIDGLIAVERIHVGGQDQRGRIRARESAIAIRRPLHRRAHAVAIAEMNVVAHSDLVAVVDDRRAGHREQKAIHQLDAAAIPFQQRRKAAANAEIDTGAPIRRVGLPEIVALGIRDHFERQLVVIAEENRPLAVFRDLRRLAHDIGNRKTVLARQRHVHARHQRKVECHVAFVTITEIVLGVFRPLVGLGEQHAARVRCIELGPDTLEDLVRLGKVLVVRSIALDQIRHGIEPQPVDAELKPEAHHADNGFEHARVIEIEVGLVRIKAMPEIGTGHRVPGPVRAFGVEEDDARAEILLVGVGPDIIVARRGTRL
jgi:hypothetical protein